MDESPAEIWREFHTKFRSANERLAGEMAAAGEHVRLLMDRLREELSSPVPGPLDSGKIDSLERLFGETENRLFSEPLGAFERYDPIGRTLAAVERHRLEMNDLARWLPPVVSISGADLVEIVVPGPKRGWRANWVKRSGAARPLQLRQIVFAHLGDQTARRYRIDAAFQRVLSQAGLHLLAAWQVCRRQQLAILTSGTRDSKALAHERMWWSRTATRLAARMERLGRAYRQWAEAADARLVEAVLRRSPKFADHRLDRITNRWQVECGTWHRQERSVRAVIALEHKLSLVAVEAAQGSNQVLDSLRGEHTAVTGELDRAVAWLESGIGQGNRDVPPAPKASLLSAEQRARNWSERFSSRVRAYIPAQVEAVRPVRLFAVWRKPWRQLRAQQVLLNALGHSGLEAARDGFREAETEHVAVIRDVEQARQVVTFALEAERADQETVANLPGEAATNAIALLQHRREIMIDPLPAAEGGLCHAQALTFLQAHTAIEIGRLGLFALIARQGAPRAARKLAQLALDDLRAASRGVWKLAGEVLRWVSWRLGWEIPAAPRFEPVVERPQLRDLLEAQLRARDLPPLYERLFRLVPVEDQRFLVGRETEMNGLGRAFSMWQSGRSVTVLVVGARGSGKTSLLNCAAKAVLGDTPLTRGQFCQRIRSSEQMSQFLTELFGLPPGADLTHELNQGRRVVIIEELERTFLRCMNGFEALRDFLRLVNDTSRSTLWILSLNQTSFRYLDALLGLGQSFSHRFNAMSVGQEHLTDAIVQRHALSGLRLQFAPPAPRGHGVYRLRRFFGLEQSAEQVFFDLLFRQSEGLFRSAFELWLGRIERIEGSVVRMLQPVDPNYSRLEAELKPEDLFTLQAILQHGSLTAEEWAEVFGGAVEEARSRLDRLLALEILEPEPACPGLRVRPPAGRFVRDALTRQNLW